VLLSILNLIVDYVPYRGDFFALAKTVCEGDVKAFPGMNEATAPWESLGSPVARNASPWWNSKSPVAELDEQVHELGAQGKKINYTVFAGGNHMYIWSFAYGIDAIRDWLFAQKK